MIVRFPEYKHGFRIISLALDENTKNDLLKDSVAFLYVDEGRMILYPEETVLAANGSTAARLRKCNNYDVFELWGTGALYRVYNNCAPDNFFFVTGNCNSNCVMCPSPDVSRREAERGSAAKLIEIATHIPTSAHHLTITGGEPFMLGEEIFEFISYLKEKFRNTEFLFLTNGRIFSVKKYLYSLFDTIPSNSTIAIPLHGSTFEVHDRITRTPGSFAQTIQGIKQLLRGNVRVEIRLVINKLNLYDLDRIAQLIIHELSEVAYVSVISMEMTGNAWINKDLVWVPYSEAFRACKAPIRNLLENGINVKLYNFPLCTVDQEYWPLCEKSISPEKVRFTDECCQCRYQRSCGGIFAGTLMLEREELKHIP